MVPALTDRSEPITLTVSVEDSVGGRHDVSLAGPSATSLHVMLDQVRRVTDVPQPLLVDGAPVDLEAPWLSGALRHGSVLSGRPSPAPQPAPLELRVVAGPSAGVVVPLPHEGATIGRHGCTLVLDDPEVSRQHASVSYASDGALSVRDLGSTNGMAVDGAVATSVDGVRAGAVLTLGESRVLVAPARSDQAALADDGRGRWLLNRPPRCRVPSSSPVEVRLPAEPARPERARVPLTALLVPLVLGAVLFLTMPSSPQYLLLMAMSPLMLVGNAVTDRRNGRRRHAAALTQYAEAVAAAERQVRAACRHEHEVLQAATPDPAELGGWATLPSSRLWERRATDDDAWALRLGVADRPASLRLLPAAGAAEPPSVPLLREVPVVLRLDEVGVLGVAGPPLSTDAFSRWLVLQAALLQGPEDVQVVVLTTPGRLDSWAWLRWLPHATRAAGREVLVGADEQSHARRLTELSRRGGSAGRHSGQVLLVVDGAQAPADSAALREVLRRSDELGVLALCLASEERLLPQECRAVAVFDVTPAGSTPGPKRPSRLVVRDATGDCTPGVLADQVSVDWADTVARGLARIAGSTGDEAGNNGLPPTCRLLDLLDLAEPGADAIARRWAANGRSTAAVLGQGADGPLVVDLAADGPHALVAGTTGAGKSELLQSLVASLAAANRPDALQFVLVDYKGGAAFRDCAMLPHTVGLVTDLDSRLTERALASLGAELRRRERLLAEHGVKDLEALWDQGDGPPVLARLVIVIDEFATLVEELPEFVRGLVGIAQRGRSLGIHLVLATQRPGGVVSPDIRANTNLRVCLRVTQPTESSDVVDSPAAADVPADLPGRGYVRTGAGALRLLQTARVGGRSPRAGARSEAPSAELSDFASLVQTPMPPAEPTGPDPDVPTDLALLVEAIRGAHAALGLPPARRPWLDPLPPVVVLDQLSGSTDADRRVLSIGLRDVPSRQQQLPYQLHLGDGRHLLLVGSPRSGRSCGLQTVAAAAVQAFTPADLHVYALDFGNGALAALARLPHCGAVVQRDEADRVQRLLARLRAELDRRQQVLAAGGFADVTEQRRHSAPADRLPWMLLLVDRWEGLVQAYQDVDLGRRIDELLLLLREGSAAGLQAVVTADRSGLLGRLPSVMADKVVLRLTDRADYALADVPAAQVPTTAPPGRGLVLGDGPTRTFHEVQIALLTGDLDGRAQQHALRHLIDAAVRRSSAEPYRQPPLRVDALPRTMTVDETRALGPVAAEASPHWALIGGGGDRLQPMGVDLAKDGPCLLLAGPPRSGRTTALKTIAGSLLASGHRLVVAAPASSALRDLARHPGTIGCLDVDATADETMALLDADPAAGPVVVMVDDAERFTDSEVGVALEARLRAGAPLWVVAAGNSDDLQSTYRGFTLEVRRSRCGLLLSPQSTLDGDLVGARLSGTSPGAVHPGRAILAVRGELTPVQVALPLETSTATTR